MIVYNSDHRQIRKPPSTLLLLCSFLRSRIHCIYFDDKIKASRMVLIVKMDVWELNYIDGC